MLDTTTIQYTSNLTYGNTSVMALAWQVPKMVPWETNKWNILFSNPNQDIILQSKPYITYLYTPFLLSSKFYIDPSSLYPYILILSIISCACNYPVEIPLQCAFCHCNTNGTPHWCPSCWFRSVWRPVKGVVHGERNRGSSWVRGTDGGGGESAAPRKGRIEGFLCELGGGKLMSDYFFFFFFYKENKRKEEKDYHKTFGLDKEIINWRKKQQKGREYKRLKPKSEGLFIYTSHSESLYSLFFIQASSSSCFTCLSVSLVSSKNCRSCSYKAHGSLQKVCFLCVVQQLSFLCSQGLWLPLKMGSIWVNPDFGLPCLLDKLPKLLRREPLGGLI
ncbi:hypothetical protein VP01_2561g2 [Puccinia sorghi]|uniref:Uncharacterized protein n=1 Tax=Puccinia sorghi TaxID=27349 RepID=A0A0L6V520_9BASI|nr:hypothetical protein VP01_2561g2 [Puccinia sorghi]